MAHSKISHYKLPGQNTLQGTHPYLLFKTYPHLKADEIKDNEPVWERLGIEL